MALKVAEQREQSRITAWRRLVCGIFVLLALKKNPNLPLHSRLGDGECGVRKICLPLLFYKLTELAGRGFGKCN